MTGLLCVQEGGFRVAGLIFKLPYRLTVDTVCPRMYPCFMRKFYIPTIETGDVYTHLYVTIAANGGVHTFSNDGGFPDTLVELQTAIARLQAFHDSFENEKHYQGVMAAEHNDYIKEMYDEEKELLAKITPAKEVKKGYVYIMKDGRNGMHKIGFSKNPKAREKTLQSEVPEITLLHAWKGCMNDEESLHDHFHSKRVRGEWFNLTPQDIKDIKSHMEEAA